jgi:flagellar protein FlaG
MINSIGSQLTPASLGLAPVAPNQIAGKPAATPTAAPDNTQSSSGHTNQQDAALKGNPPAPPSSLEKALEVVNDSLTAWSTGMRFDVDKDTQQLVISIIDSASGDVIKKIPSEAMLRIAKMIVQLQGSGVDTKA